MIFLKIAILSPSNLGWNRQFLKNSRKQKIVLSNPKLDSHPTFYEYTSHFFCCFYYRAILVEEVAKYFCVNYIVRDRKKASSLRNCPIYRLIQVRLVNEAIGSKYKLTIKCSHFLLSVFLIIIIITSTIMHYVSLLFFFFS